MNKTEELPLAPAPGVVHVKQLTVESLIGDFLTASAEKTKAYRFKRDATKRLAKAMKSVGITAYCFDLSDTKKRVCVLNPVTESIQICCKAKRI